MDWQPVTVPLSALTPWEKNPKRISRAHAKRLLELWERLGQFQTIAIGPAGQVYDGHQRLSVLRAAHGDAYQVKALQSSRALTEDERAELTISAHAGTTGSWDWDALSGWDASALQGWGFDSEALQDWRAGVAALDAMIAGDDWAEAFDGLPDEDRAPFQQMTFTLRDEQAETVKRALSLAKSLGAFVDTGNENSNGNALALICEGFITDNEHG